ncbi:MAG TPA: hypothetical protein VEQ11_17145 [Chloroflexota bacterium]|nr:hypothetical protein [Chloroflexota bacterium]
MADSSDNLKPGWAVPGKSVPVKVGPLGPTIEIPALRCDCGGDALPIDSSYDAQKDTIIYLCPDCGASVVEPVR